MSEEITPALVRYSISEAGGESTGVYGIEVEDEWGDFVRFADVQRLFTREDVDAIRNADGGDMERNRFLDSIAARIAALLPPEQLRSSEAATPPDPFVLPPENVK